MCSVKHIYTKCTISRVMLSKQFLILQVDNPLLDKSFQKLSKTLLSSYPQTDDIEGNVVSVWSFSIRHLAILEITDSATIARYKLACISSRCACLQVRTRVCATRFSRSLISFSFGRNFFNRVSSISIISFDYIHLNKHRLLIVSCKGSFPRSQPRYENFNPTTSPESC